jgi:hypothetical protein
MKCKYVHSNFYRRVGCYTHYLGTFILQYFENRVCFILRVENKSGESPSLVGLLEGVVSVSSLAAL